MAKIYGVFKMQKAVKNASFKVVKSKMADSSTMMSMPIHFSNDQKCITPVLKLIGSLQLFLGYQYYL